MTSMLTFKEIYLLESQKSTFEVKSTNIFLKYPRDIINDIEDKFGDYIDDYDIEENTINIFFKNNTDKTVAIKIIEYIKSVK